MGTIGLEVSRGQTATLFEGVQAARGGAPRGEDELARVHRNLLQSPTAAPGSRLPQSRDV